MIDLGVVSDWLGRWPEFSRPITVRRKVEPLPLLIAFKFNHRQPKLTSQEKANDKFKKMNDTFKNMFRQFFCC